MFLIETTFRTSYAKNYKNECIGIRLNEHKFKQMW